MGEEEMRSNIFHLIADNNNISAVEAMVLANKILGLLQHGLPRVTSNKVAPLDNK